MFEGQRFIAKTLAGLEALLAEELRAMGAEKIKILKRGVEFEGDTALMCRANLSSRLALRILAPVHSFSARDERGFYEGVRKVNWQYWMDVSQTLAVDAVGRSERFSHSHYLALLTKDAIVDQFRERLDQRPDVNPDFPDLRVHVHYFEDKFTVCLDSSGDSLHLRGWRGEQVAAPINEVLAAAMIQLSGWSSDQPLVDPMCGSGTLLIEAAMLATQTPSQLFRKVRFGFLRWKKFDKAIWERVLAEEKAKIKPADGLQLFGFDADPLARNISRRNAMAAGFEKTVLFEKMNFGKLDPPTEPPGVVMMNPPYDERLAIEDTALFYSKIGERLKHHWAGWTAWIISSNRDALKSIGLKTAQKITLFNGPLECSFQKIELYEGSRRAEKTEE